MAPGGRPRAAELKQLNSLIAAFMACLLMTGQALAWGSEGHRIVAEIAEQYLEPTTTRQVRELLAIENQTTLAEIANWADQIRGQRRNTAPWHFVDIPIGAAGYDAVRDCPRGACVVAKIDEFAAQLRDRSLPPHQRLEALKFLVHFVGDVHQPLHAADDDDKGGNEVRVQFLGHRTNLHAVWDTALLAPVVHGDERGYALMLDGRITQADNAKWGGGSAVDWANDSHVIAAQVIYRDLPHEASALPAAYERHALPVVNEQLEKAGVRLGALLNATLR
jgi:hypothetical protein